MTKHIAIYLRVSSNKQDTRSQEPDLNRWVEAFADGQSVKRYSDKQTGKSMDRPGWKELEADLRAGKVAKVVCWRLDRLGRTASGLTSLFEELLRLGVEFVSVKDGIDLSTPAGRLMANVLASVAAYETEVRGERVLAGQAAARANGKRWGGSKAGRRSRKVVEATDAIQRMRDAGEPVAKIARVCGVSRDTVYKLTAETSVT